MTLGQEQEQFCKDVQKLFDYIHTNGFNIRTL